MPSPVRDNSAEVEAYYAAHPEFFVVKTPSDLPADLEWTDGGEFPELGSPERVRGGTLHGRTPTVGSAPTYSMKT